MSTKRVTDALTVQKFNDTSTGLSGTAQQLNTSLKEIESELVKDKEGEKEYQDYLDEINRKKAELQKRIDENKAWVAAFEKDSASGSFESQYKQLLHQIEQIYGGAKDFHSKGIDMLIKEFSYHLAYKRWNDTFTAVPFKPR